VDKAINRARRIVVDDILYIGPIQAAGRHVRGDYHIVTVVDAASLGQELDRLEPRSLCYDWWNINSVREGKCQ
jgi:hypothetical protein